MSNTPSDAVDRRTFLKSSGVAGAGVLSTSAQITTARPSASVNGPQQDFTVMSYNIHHGEGTDGIYDLRRVAGIIWAVDPDIVALQEVDAHWSNRSEFDNQPELLAEWLDMELAFYRYYNRPPTEESNGKRRQFGDVILSKYPILGTNGYPLPQENKDKPYFDRLLSEAKINVTGSHIWFYDAHLYAFEANRRSIQIEKMLDITQERDGPQVLAGDFNSFSGQYLDRDNSNYQTLSDAYVDVLRQTGDDGPTYPAPLKGSKDRRIDYIFATPDVGIKGGNVGSSIAADHRPLTATLTI